MKGRLIPVLVGSMTAAMLVIVAVQVSWLESSAKLRKEVFDQSVEQSLQLVANWLTATHLDDPQAEDPQLLRTDELAPEERLIVRRMEALPMDSLLRLAFQEQGIEADPVFGAYNRYGQPVYLLDDAEPFNDALLARGYSVALGTLQLRVHFPKLGRYLIGQMLGAFALSVMMMLLIAGGLATRCLPFSAPSAPTGFSETWSTTSPTSSRRPFPALDWPVRRCLTPHLTRNRASTTWD